MKAPTPSFTQACTAVLVLALTAPTDAQAEEAGALAEEFAQHLTAKQVEACKAAALQIAEMQMQRARKRGSAA